MKNKTCHNCRKEESLKSKGVNCQINKITAWFDSMACYKRWYKKYKGKFQGGIIDQK